MSSHRFGVAWGQSILGLVVGIVLGLVIGSLVWGGAATSPTPGSTTPADTARVGEPGPPRAKPLDGVPVSVEVRPNPTMGQKNLVGVVKLDDAASAGQIVELTYNPVSMLSSAPPNTEPAEEGDYFLLFYPVVAENTESGTFTVVAVNPAHEGLDPTDQVTVGESR